jgi:hypothetical protein
MNCLDAIPRSSTAFNILLPTTSPTTDNSHTPCKVGRELREDLQQLCVACEASQCMTDIRSCQGCSMHCTGVPTEVVDWYDAITPLHARRENKGHRIVYSGWLLLS